MSNNLEEKGFVIFRNVIDKQSIDYARNQINSKVNYYKLKRFIDTEMMRKVNILTNKDLDYIKYRVSNSNNSSDAGAFHRDIHTYEKTQPIYTCLAYLDESVLEIIPKSHKELCISYLDFNKFYNSKIQLKMNPGDLLLFNASLLHRGIFYKTKSKNRRLIQLFDCVSLRDMKKYEESILHIPCRNECSSLISNSLIKINKNKFSSDVANRIALIASFRGYGYKINPIKFMSNDKQIKHISTESERNRPSVNIYDDQFHESNTYNVNKYKIKDIDKKKRGVYAFYSYSIELIMFLMLWIFIFILMYVLITKIILVKLKQNRSKIKKCMKSISKFYN